MEEIISPTLVEKAATPRSLQDAPPYISRAPYYPINPSLFTNEQWRFVAKEPITRLCVRHIIREIVSLDWDIISEAGPKRDDTGVIDYFTRVFEEADDGDGWDYHISRVVQDALELPIGGVVEPAPDDFTGMAGAIYHVDGATVFPTFDPIYPFVQINPFNSAERVYFQKGDLIRLLFQPRTDLRRKQFQESPVESALMGIEALSKMYLYYMRQLSDTPIAGILDLMDMSAGEAQDWAREYREMLEGIDPLKIPVLYDHVKPARFIGLGRSPQDVNIVEQFKRFAEIVIGNFGLSIGDLRLFEHDRTLAGVESSQRVTERSGIGFYAQAIEDFINRTILFSHISKIKLKFKRGTVGKELQETELSNARAQMLMTLTGNQPLLKPEDAQKQLEQWKMVDIEITGMPKPPGLPGFDVGEEETKKEVAPATDAYEFFGIKEKAKASNFNSVERQHAHEVGVIRKSLASAQKMATFLEQSKGTRHSVKSHEGRYYVMELSDQ